MFGGRGHVGVHSCVTVIVTTTACGCFPSMFFDLIINYFDLHLFVVEGFHIWGKRFHVWGKKLPLPMKIWSSSLVSTRLLSPGPGTNYFVNFVCFLSALYDRNSSTIKAVYTGLNTEN